MTGPQGMGALKMFAATTLKPAIIALGPVGYWILNETAGSTAIDYSGLTRNGTYNGPTLAGVAGGDGSNYASFDGTNDYVAIADNNDWTLDNGGLTIFALIRPTSSGIRDVIAKGGPGGAGQNEWELRASSDELLCTVWNPNGSEYSRWTCATFPTISQWNVIALTIEDLTGSINKFRLNKVNIIPTGSGGSGAPGNTTSPIRIGSRDHGDRFFPGGEAHIAIFKPKLTVVQIQSLENAADVDGWI